MRVVFMGTPDFAVGTLERIIADGHEVVGVYTQPDKPKGRGKELAMPPVKEVAIANGIPVYQPERVKEPAVLEQLKELNPDVIVVVAFGQILPESILQLPQYGCVNVHASLLPAYRGAAPIQWAVIDGLEKTGVTTMLMDKGLDTGDMLMQAEIYLDEKETGGSLFDRLCHLGAEVLSCTLIELEKGSLIPVPQNHEQSSYAKMLDKSMGNMDFNKSAVELERLVRGLNPWPSAYTYYNGKQLKIWDCDVVEGYEGKVCGEVAEVNKDNFIVACNGGALKVLELQIEGKKRMDCGSFLRGVRIQVGDILG